MIITKALMVHFKGTPFESSLYRTTGFRMVNKQEMQEQGDNYEAAIKEKFKKFTSELEMAKRVLNEIVINNAQTILQHDVSLRDFPQEQFPSLSASQTLNITQCSIWARKIINTCRRDLLRYEGDNPNIFNLLATIDNSTVERIITPYLQDFKGGHNTGFVLLKSVIYNNLAIILQSHADLLNFPKNYFKDAFDINQVTDNQYKIWARRIISEAREELLAYNGKNQQILTTLNIIDNTHLEHYVAVELKNILEGSDD
ncbi:hypothetical protein [Candidatus Odyssella thessalonicensis]|uniref:hypothetical protein n=1 Tax=Candidatus Odyssella thessalonicensis TaxID=84647 RepID=UPI0003020059|nr:hypothetical protein [Candidatus Odyssella thessalonicensis]